MIRANQNTESKNIKAILTADFHLREDIPICRTDNFWEAQWKKVDFISALQKKYNCPVLHAGDLFHHWKPSPYLLSETIKHLPEWFYTCYGNHDLPQHNIELAEKSGIHTLRQAQKLLIMGVNWNQTPDKELFDVEVIAHRGVLLWHVMTYLKGQEPYPGCTESPANVLLKKYSDYDLIVTGDNHQSFTTSLNGRILVNPGSLTRQTANQINHKPCVWLWDAQSNSIAPVYLPIEKNVISRQHIEVVEQRDERINSFISKLDADWDVELSFEENLTRFEKANQIKKPIMDIIYKSIEV